MSASLDPERTLQHIAGLAVPAFADWAVVDRFEPDDLVTRVAVRHVDPSKVELAHDAFRRFGPSRAEVAALRVAGPVLIPRVPDEYLVATAKSEEHLALSRQLGFRSAMLVPLRGHAVVHGCLSFITTDETGRTYDETDLAVAIDLARRAGVAYDNALLHREVADARERYRLATEAMRGLVYDFDMLAGTVVHSSGLEQLVGVSPSEQTRPVGWWLSRVHPDDLPAADRRSAQAFAAGTTRLESTYRVRHDSGAWRWVSDTAQVVYDAAGHPVRMVGCTVDVTESVVARQALLAADERKDQFLAVLGHELRNPLAAIRAAVDVLAGPDTRGVSSGGPTPTAASGRAREVVVRQVRHMGRMLEDLLDVSRIQLGKLTVHEGPVDLARVADETVADLAALAASGGVTVSLSAPSPAPVLGDATRLAQIVANLLDNAIKFSPSGGRVEVSVTAQPDEVLLEVADEGPGVAPELAEQLFEPFVQGEAAPERRHAGLGLGLALVRGLVVLHRGRVEVRSVPGRGARFVLWFPRLEGDPSSDVAPADSGAGRRVLLVEDNADTADMMRVLLELWGHEVEVAGDGPAAVAVAERFRPEVVLCDIGLPGGMDGLMVARHLRAALGPEPLLVALTGFGQASDRQRTADAGFDQHLVKPVDPDALEPLVGRGPGRAG